MKGSNLVGFSFGLSPSNVRYSFTDKPDHKRILVLDFVRGEGARPCFLNIEPFERLERFERSAFASDRGFGKIDKIVGSDPGDDPGDKIVGSDPGDSGRLT